ncbi:MAG TPA: class I tRNA ligase family protein, partial [Puia sp.]|nr:class I tRNA ligase family protein [Puia sp.]
STQWFVRMKEMAGPALKAVTEGYIHIHPGDKFLATYKYWLENVKDWCISRQLWWGQQIPAWYAPDGSFQVAATREQAYALFSAAGEPAFALTDLRQDEDVLDTWFSSWLWPIEVFKGVSNPGNPDIRYYYPTAVLVTGQDIIFFWVARMIMAGLYYFPDSLSMERRIPFRDVYFTGMVRDNLGRKMSKSLGNSPDLLMLIDKYGADAVRFGIMIASPAGNDLLFDEAALEQGRNFNNKLWNALKLVRTVWQVADPETVTQPKSAEFAVTWFRNKLNKVTAEVDNLYQSFRLSEALKTIYSLIWDDFCSWYLEWIKPEYGQPIDHQTYKATISFFEDLLQLLHPFMPFITEEIYHLLDVRDDDLCVRQFREVGTWDNEVIRAGTTFQNYVSKIREFRVANNIKTIEKIEWIGIPFELFNIHVQLFDIALKQTNAKEASVIAGTPMIKQLTNFPAHIPFKTKEEFNNLGTSSSTTTSTTTMLIDGYEFPLIVNQKIDLAGKKVEYLRELDHLKGFLTSVEKKLNNERFVQNAKPEVINLERKKKEDTELKIKAVEENLAKLK